MILEDGIGFFEMARKSDFSEPSSNLQTSEVSLLENVKIPPLPNGAFNSTIESTYISGSTFRPSSDGLVKGVTTVQAERGLLNFSEIQIIADPGSFITVKVKSDLISRFRGEYLSWNNSFDRMEQSTGEYAFILKAFLRNCERG